MRKIILFILLSVLLLVPKYLLAQVNLNVTGGNAICLPHESGLDSLFLFEDLTTAMLQTPDANPKWWKFQDGDSLLVATGTETFFPEHNTGYILHTAEGRCVFWVWEYAQCKAKVHSIEANTDHDNTCEETQLLLEAIIPEMSYQDIYGEKHTMKRECEVEYHSLSWNGEEWVDTLCMETMPLRNVITVGAPLQNTIFTLYDRQFATILGTDIDSISTREYEARAVKAYPTTITATRGELEENEAERPVDEKKTTGSAPLDIFFQPNPTPAVKYYRWEIRKGNDLIVQRTDEEQRYTFDEHGGYRALLWVSNDYCTSDSVEITITVSSSQLRVPNVFTPNGDGVNDEFRVAYRSIIEFHGWVYDRWGHKVFEWTDPAKGWDGKINGKDAAESAYFYVIRAKGADYNPQEEIGIYELKGDINLIRGKKK